MRFPRGNQIDEDATVLAGRNLPTAVAVGRLETVLNLKTEIVLPSGTPLHAALDAIAEEGRRGHAVLVPSSTMPMLRRARAPLMIQEGNEYFRFPPPKSASPRQGSRIPGWPVAGFSLLLIAPFLLLLSLLLLLLNGRPLLFRQSRVGLHGRRFTLYKFRTLDTTATQTLRFGGFLRRHGLDELPQLWNILAGEMAWFGPRPLPCGDPAPQSRWFRERETVRPGLTGLYQTCPGRRGLRIEEMAALDLFYVRNASPALCLRIFFRTFPAMLLGWGRQRGQ